MNEDNLHQTRKEQVSLSIIVYELRNNVNLPDSGQIEEILREKKKLFDQILSTFKFTN